MTLRPAARLVSSTLAFSVLALFLAASAEAAPPTLGPLAATDVQGVSALLTGSVNPNGSATAFRFEYIDEAAYQANLGAAKDGFAGAASTPSAPVGSDSAPHPVHAAIAALTPNTTYDFRLLATSSDPGSPVLGSPATFATTQGFGFLPAAAGFDASLRADGGAAATHAGTHPYQLDLGVGLNLGGEFEGQPGVPFADGDLRDLRIDLPPGLLLNPKALDKCRLIDFHTLRSSPFEQSASGESCPNRTQVGTIELRTSAAGGQRRRFGLFNLQPPPGVAAQLGAAPFGSPVAFDIEIHTNADDSYALSLTASDFPQALDAYGLSLSLWGIPWNASHNGERGNCLDEAEPDFPWAKCSIGDPLQDAGNRPLAYLTLPTGCEGALAFAASADSWQQPRPVSATAVNRNSLGEPAEQSGCQSFSFEPLSEGFLTDTKASSASGFNFRLSADSSALTIPSRQLPSQSRRALVTLPLGVTINPSLGAGLIGCTPGQYAAESAFSPPGAGCPNGSKIGDFSVRSPLFDELFEGAVYLAEPDDPATATPAAENPFDTMIAIYLVAKVPQRGLLVKFAGKLVPDPGDGQILATFEGLPQLPYSDLNVDFRTGQRAPLITPPACGAAITGIDLTPWSGPGAHHSNTPSQIATGIDDGPCPSAATPAFSPGVFAGGVNSNVGSYTPYFVHLTRRDNEQEITSYSLILPKGITAKLAGIPFCPDSAIEQARRSTGTAEAASPSCPQASLVGHTLSGYGVGSALTYASGRIYLAGPYHGSPLSLVTINSATVGPFDLGTIVIRSAFDVDEHTAQLRIDSRTSDPIPHIIDGIPLHLREVRVYIDRPQFTHNPSSCEPSQLESTLTGSGARFSDPSDDASATVTEHFQLLNCRTLGFKPKLGLRLRGGTRRRAYPELRATFASRGSKDSNLKDIAVVVPHQMFVAQEHIRGICGQSAFAAERCPADSVYGRAVAYTPLFDAPLRGDVYLRSNPVQHLPDLVADLHSGAVRIVVNGEIEGAPGGGLRAAFTELPDAPIDRFVMTLYGGKRGLLRNSANVCVTPPLVSVKTLAQNNLGSIFTSTLRGQCDKGGKR
jgi:hypothetical protein